MSARWLGRGWGSQDSTIVAIKIRLCDGAMQFWYQSCSAMVVYPDKRIRGWSWIMMPLCNYTFRHRGSRCVLESCLHPPSSAVTSAQVRVKTNSWCQTSCANRPHYPAIIRLACADPWLELWCHYTSHVTPARGHRAQGHRRVWHQHCRLYRWLKCIAENGGLFYMHKSFFLVLLFYHETAVVTGFWPQNGLSGLFFSVWEELPVANFHLSPIIIAQRLQMLMITFILKFT